MLKKIKKVVVQQNELGEEVETEIEVFVDEDGNEVDPKKAKEGNKSIKDLHRFKEENKQKDLLIAQLQSQLSKKEEEELAEKQEYKSLAEKRKMERDNLIKEKEELIAKFVLKEARNELIKATGIKSQYAEYLKPEKIVVDGEIQSDLLENYVKEFIQKNPDLLEKKGKNNLPNTSPKGLEEVDEIKDISKMSPTEQLAYYRKLIQAEKK